MNPYLIPLDADAALNSRLAGGKGANLARLRALYRQAPSALWHVPEGFVLTTDAFAQSLADALRGGCPGGEIDRSRAAQLREEITAGALPDAVRTAVLWACARLGPGPIAVRSSSTHEDGVCRAAAGHGSTVLCVAGEQALLAAVREVWASQFSDAFVNAGVTGDSLMAVVLQPMVEPDHAGVMFTCDPDTGRPGFRIRACRGLGSGVVDGSAESGSWFVAPECHEILEEEHPNRAWPDPGQWLRLACAGQMIREHYVGLSLASELDIEFAFSRHDLVILQARPVTALPAIRRESRYLRVDLDRLPAAIPRIELGGLCASRGAAAAPLQVIEDPADFAATLAGRIVVVPHTNSRWTGVIAQMAGIITMSGNELSHAAVTAREAAIPAVVGCAGAVERMRSLAGETITLDTGMRAAFVGTAPIREEADTIDCWRSRDELAASAAAEKAQAEAAACESLWERLQPLGHTLEDWEGRWLGKPRLPYCYLQWDCYIEGFRRLDRRLNALGVAAHHACLVKKNILWQPVPEVPPRLTEDLAPVQLAGLVLAHREAFRRGERFVTEVARLDASSVDELADLLPELMSHMHLAYWVETELHRRARRHLRCAAEPLQPLLLEQAFRHDARLTAADRHSVRREKEIALGALCAAIRADAAAMRAFDSDDTETVERRLAEGSPGVLARIVSLSQRFKMGSEDLRQTSDAPSYLKSLRERLREPSAGLSAARLVNYCEEYVAPASTQTPEQLLETIRASSPDLRALLAAGAREFDTGLTDLARGILGAWRKKDDLRETLARYPNLANACSLALQAARLRDDGHELITRFQRKAASLLRSVGDDAARAGILRDPEHVFHLSLVEVGALVKEGASPRYVGETVLRRRLLEVVEDSLDIAWTRANANFPMGIPAWREAVGEAVRGYKRDIPAVLDCLERQRAEARAGGNARIAEEYEQERARIARRLTELKLRTR